MKDKWVKIGYIANTHGIRGEVKAEAVSAIPDRLLHLKHAYAGEEKQPVEIVSAKEHKGMTLLRFAGFDTINQVLPFKGRYLYVPETETAVLPEDSWYHYQLKGLTAIDPETREAFGTVSDIRETYANDVLAIDTEKGELLIPFVHALVGRVDPEAGTIEVRRLEMLE
ncbi:MAG: ribosome maturation factor RimM [Peptoniphilaceae bacterium]|jgi:16S rRNA processing protein RimM|nr:ribosome maturation factor RimM [Bacillota bacterium]